MAVFDDNAIPCRISTYTVHYESSDHPTRQTVTLRETICLLFPSEIEIAQPRMFVAFDEILMVKCVYTLDIIYYYNMYRPISHAHKIR